MEETATVVTKREEMTTEDQKDTVRVIAMPAWQIVGVRTLRVYLQSLIGFLIAGGTGLSEAVTGLSAGNFGHQLLVAASLAVAPATMSFLQNTVEILTKLDATNPTLRA